MPRTEIAGSQATKTQRLLGAALPRQAHYLYLLLGQNIEDTFANQVLGGKRRPPRGQARASGRRDGRRSPHYSRIQRRRADRDAAQAYWRHGCRE
jgi:hypothetical protein